MPTPVLSKLRQGYWYTVTKLGYKPRALGIQFYDWILLSDELGHPDKPVEEYMGMYVFLIDGSDGRVRFFEHRPPRKKAKSDS